MVKGNAFWIGDLFTKQSQKNPSSPLTPSTSVSWLEQKWFHAKECIPCFAFLQLSLLAEHTAKCFTSVHLPMYYLLSPSVESIHACVWTSCDALHVRCVCIWSLGTSLQQQSALLPKLECRDHSPCNFGVPFTGRLHCLIFQDAFLYRLSRWTIICWGRTSVH